MNLRKLAALVAALGLIVGLVGSGISATFLQSLSATETINVASFDCGIIADGTTPAAVVAGDGMSVSYTPPTVTSSAPSSAPFTFVVKNSGDAPASLSVTAPSVSGPYSVIGPLPSGVLAVNGTSTVATGIAWTELSRDNLGSLTFTWTVTCDEYVAPVVPAAQPDTYAYESTNAQNVTNGWANVASVPGTGSVALTFTQPRAFYACFEYRTDGNVPEQRLNVDGTTVGVAPFAPSIASTYGISGVNDRYLHVCLSTAGSSQTVTLTGITYAEVRMSFGAESNERFGWTRFNAL